MSHCQHCGVEERYGVCDCTSTSKADKELEVFAEGMCSGKDLEMCCKLEETNAINFTAEQAVVNVKLPVMEIFSSIQGEGAMMGMPVTFVRFAGCNLRCPWCDTKESWVVQPEQSNSLSIEDIVAKCDMAVVVLTGGEPCMYNLDPLVELLQNKGKFVCIETNGTLPTPANIDWVTASPKPPEYLINADCFFNELKYVVDDVFNLDCIPEPQKLNCGGTWLQPCDYGKGNEKKTEASMQRCVDLTLTTGYLRTGIQLHKILAIK
jgi:7-carboxy-7-deazaguanine synthase